MSELRRKLKYDIKINREFNKLYDFKKEERLIKRALLHQKNEKLYAEKYAKSKELKETDLKIKQQRKEELSSQIKNLIDYLFNNMLKDSKDINVFAVVKKYSKKLDELQNLNDQYITISKEIDHSKTINNYYTLFLNLTNENKEFFYVTPFEAFRNSFSSDIPVKDKTLKFHFSQFNEEEMLKLQDFFIEKDKTLLKDVKGYESIFNSEHFQINYLRYFPKYIKKLTKDTDITRALIIDPSQYPQVATTDVKNLLYYATRSPKILNYFSVEELELYASNSRNLGKKIVEMPELIDKLPNNFFTIKDHSFKYCFVDTTARELEPLAEKLSRFDGWDRYYKVKSQMARTHTNKEKRPRRDKAAMIKAQLEDYSPID